MVLRATGRVPYTEGLGLEEVGVETERGRIVVDDHLRTNVGGVWAIGDVIGGIMLAHVASYEGVCAVENITGHADRTPDYHAAPNCIYTDPEIANVGLGEKEARESGLEVKVGRFPFAAFVSVIVGAIHDGQIGLTEIRRAESLAQQVLFACHCVEPLGLFQGSRG